MSRGSILHVRFHLAELLADPLEPTDLTARYVTTSGANQALDPPPVALIQVEAIGATLVDQRRNAETLVLEVNLSFVAQLQQDFCLPVGNLVALPVSDVLQKPIRELRALSHPAWPALHTWLVYVESWPVCHWDRGPTFLRAQTY
jgi:hypothetical protein